LKTLLNNIKSGLESSITAGRLSVTSIVKGLAQAPDKIPFTKYPFIAIDDNGESVKSISTESSQVRVYSVVFTIGTYAMNIETAIDSVLDISDQLKAEIESDALQFYNGHEWGLSITPWEWADEQYFFRGRTVTVDYFRTESTLFIH
jgi:hypothetical protein